MANDQESTSLTTELNIHKTSVRDLMSSRIKKQQMKLHANSTEEINYRPWITGQLIEFDPRTQEEKEATMQIRKESECEDES